MMVNYDDAADAAARLSRTIGYPKSEPAGFEALVDGVMNACHRHGIDPEKLVSRCGEMSQYCPTDVDLDRIAKDLAGEPSWEQVKPSKCERCGGSGFEVVHALHSREGHGEYSYTRKQRITGEQYEALSRQVDNVRQKTYTGAKRCTAGCPVPGWKS